MRVCVYVGITAVHGQVKVRTFDRSFVKMALQKFPKTVSFSLLDLTFVNSPSGGAEFGAPLFY